MRMSAWTLLYIALPSKAQGRMLWCGLLRCAGRCIWGCGLHARGHQDIRQQGAQHPDCPQAANREQPGSSIHTALPVGSSISSACNERITALFSLCPSPYVLPVSLAAGALVSLHHCLKPLFSSLSPSLLLTSLLRGPPGCRLRPRQRSWSSCLRSTAPPKPAGSRCSSSL